ncbi:TonB-dependent receptor [Pelomonas sp. UHG3]|uniref:TonB-dependent receptor n=1 Tax=Roseateles hydrophilus TaxID=2975054 RepID=A0ACC6C6Y8_9BURK|nr:TonB-dependent receptor [Pelomonas sp. UHG3]MCY4744162.1 TonB-dependent receptor [Pelomonas sp. UHG3]
MTLNTEQRSTAARASFRISPVAVGCVMLIAAASATAQQAAPQQLETVTVTGIRKGIEAAISVKRNSDSIVEAISAEDIGKLPDSSIAESIARLPGLTAQRVNGRAQEVQIRGLAGQFATTLLNGREQVSTGDNRSAEFDQYPSELLSGVTIYKTPDAALVGQGLSGTIDLQTVRPLNFASRAMALNLRAEKNSLGRLNPGAASDKGSRFSFSYIDQFADRTVGVALGYARLDSPNQNNYFRNWGYPTGNGAVGATTYTDVRLPGGVQLRNESASQKRNGLMGVVQWKPSKDFETIVDAYHSTYERIALQRGFEAGLAWSGAQLVNPVVEGATQTGPNAYKGGVLTKADYVGVKPVLRHDANDRDDTITALGWNSKLVLSPALTLVGDLSWSKAKRQESIMELYAGTGAGGSGATDTFKVSLPVGGGLPTISAGLNYADPSLIKLVDAGGWGQAGYLKKPEVKDEIKSAKLSGKYSQELLFFSGIEGGVNITQREKSRNVPEWFLDLKTSPTTIPANMLFASNSMAYAGLGDFISYDARAAAAQFYNLRANLGNKDIINKDWTVKETITTAFVKADIDSELLGMPLRGNLGVQAVNAEQESRAFSIQGGTTSPTTRGTDYTDWLPSMNLTWQVANNQNVRFGVARQITRPRMDDMRATQSYGVDNTRRIWTGDGGNPELKPWKADAVDLSYEYYFGNKGYVSVAAYYKDLKTYIYKQKLNVNFRERFGTLTPPGSVTPASDIGEYETQANGQGGSMSGAELAVSVPLQIVAPILDGFGVQLSYAYVQSKISPFGPGDSRPLPGLSPNTYNLTAYYEKYGFSARVSTRIRDGFVGEVTGFGADRTFEYVKKEKVTDLQLGYEFQGGMAKGLSVLFQINNVGNEPYVEYYNNDLTQTKQYTKYGKTYLFGVNYKF